MNKGKFQLCVAVVLFTLCVSLVLASPTIYSHLIGWLEGMTTPDKGINFYLEMVLSFLGGISAGVVLVASILPVFVMGIVLFVLLEWVGEKYLFKQLRRF